MDDNNIVLRVVRVTTAEENSTDCGLTGTDVSLCVCVWRTAVCVCLYSFSKWIAATHVRGVGVKKHARTHVRLQTRRQQLSCYCFGANARRQNIKRTTSRAGGRRGDRRKCYYVYRNTRTAYAVTTRFQQLPTFFTGESQ